MRTQVFIATCPLVVVGDQAQALKRGQFRPYRHHLGREPTIRKRVDKYSAWPEHSADFAEYLHWPRQIFDGNSTDDHVKLLVIERQTKRSIEVMNTTLV